MIAIVDTGTNARWIITTTDTVYRYLDRSFFQ